MKVPSLNGLLKRLFVFRPLLVRLIDFDVAGLRYLHMLTCFLFLLSLLADIRLFKSRIDHQVAIFYHKHRTYATVVVVVLAEELIALLFWDLQFV